MGNNQTEKAFEEKRLAQTISLAEEQLKQAKEAADKKKSEIIEAKKDVRENTEHGITSLYTSDGFEALVELSQYINPVTDKIIDYEEEEHKILLLEKMIKSPYFARIDFLPELILNLMMRTNLKKYTLDVLLYEKTAIKRCMFMIGDRRLPVFSIVL